MAVSRSRTEQVSGTWRYSASNGYSASGTSNVESLSESISQSVRGKYNDCSHTKVEHEYNFSVSGVYTTTPSLITQTCTGYGFHQPSWAVRAWSFGPWSFDVQSLASEAYQAMRPTMSTGTSLTNFLLELRDFRSLFKLWDKTKSLLQNAASGHLNYSFGWKPMIKDITDLVTGAAEFDKRFHDFLSRAGSYQHRRFRKKLGGQTFTSATALLPEMGGNWYGYHVHQYTELTFASCISYVYSLPQYSYREMRFRAILDTLGLNLKPSQIWQAIPFSFLFDWFWNMTRLLESIESNLLDPKMRVDMCMYSTKIVGTDTLYAREVPTSSASGNSYQPFARHSFKKYQRWRGFPVTIDLPEFQVDQSLGRIALGASLFVTRR